MEMTLQALRKVQWKERADYVHLLARQSATLNGAAHKAGLSPEAFGLYLKRYTGKTFTQIKEQS